jgi:hypothetical protein
MSTINMHNEEPRSNPARGGITPGCPEMVFMQVGLILPLGRHRRDEVWRNEMDVGTMRKLLSIGQATKPNEYSDRQSRFDVEANPPLYRVRTTYLTDEMDDFQGTAAVELTVGAIERSVEGLARDGRATLKLVACKVWLEGEERFPHAASWQDVRKEFTVDIDFDVEIQGDCTLRIRDTLNCI